MHRVLEALAGKTVPACTALTLYPPFPVARKRLQWSTGDDQVTGSGKIRGVRRHSALLVTSPTSEELICAVNVGSGVPKIRGNVALA